MPEISHSPLPWSPPTKVLNGKGQSYLFSSSGHPVLRFIDSLEKGQVSRVKVNQRLVEKSILCAQLVLQAYAEGLADGGSVSWEKLEDARAVAEQAFETMEVPDAED